MFEYRATVTGVYDGDTITVDIDLGFSVTLHKYKIRLLGVDAPELRGGTEASRKRGRASRDFLRGLVLGKEIILTTVKDKKGKYGRYLGQAIIGGQCVNLNLLEQKHAKKYIGYELLEHPRF